MEKETEGYGLSSEKTVEKMQAPKINYLPRKPFSYHPKIALIGAGGISDYHLKNYKAFGLDVVAIADRTLAKAILVKDKYYPGAAVYDHYQKILERDDIEVVDIATHPKERLEIIRAALEAQKHVLSQKPFVLKLDAGRELVQLARQKGVKLAVNQIRNYWKTAFLRFLTAMGSNLDNRQSGL
jgi:predicted dehydrogenase